MIEMLSISPAGKPLEPKYLEFLNYISRLNLITETLSTALVNKFDPAKGGHRRAVDMSKGTETTLLGSPWTQGTPSGSNCGRVIRHLCPSEQVFLQLRAEGRMVILQPSFSSSSQIAVSLSGVSRNGYTSGNTSLAKGELYMKYDANPSLVYYDSATDQLYSMLGSNKSGPTVWTIPA